ncbi:unnamed protein product [Boreogadus saida]
MEDEAARSESQQRQKEDRETQASTLRPREEGPRWESVCGPVERKQVREGNGVSGTSSQEPQLARHKTSAHDLGQAQTTLIYPEKLSA